MEHRMQHRLRSSTRAVALATTGACMVAAVDLVDLFGLGAVNLLSLLVLTLGAAVTLRLRAVGITVTATTVIVHNLLRTHELPRSEVVAFTPGSWRSELLLADGATVPSLLRDVDVDGDLLESPQTETVIDLTDASSHADGATS